jgi:hypothetical protein
MRYLDVRVRLPVNKLGPFVDELPVWAQMVGYDKLEEEDTPKKKNKGGRPPVPNGSYVPGKGTSAEAILKYLNKGPARRSVIMKALKNKFHEKALSSAIKGLNDRGKIIKQQDGTYVVA